MSSCLWYRMCMYPYFQILCLPTIQTKQFWTIFNKRIGFPVFAVGWMTNQMWQIYQWLEKRIHFCQIILYQYIYIYIKLCCTWLHINFMYVFEMIKLIFRCWHSPKAYWFHNWYLIQFGLIIGFLDINAFWKILFLITPRLNIDWQLTL